MLSLVTFIVLLCRSDAVLGIWVKYNSSNIRFICIFKSAAGKRVFLLDGALLGMCEPDHLQWGGAGGCGVIEKMTTYISHFEFCPLACWPRSPTTGDLVYTVPGAPKMQLQGAPLPPQQGCRGTFTELWRPQPHFSGENPAHRVLSVTYT